MPQNAVSEFVKMDDKVNEIDSNHVRLGNALCASGDLEDALQIAENKERRYFPIAAWEDPRIGRILFNSQSIYQGSDVEYDVIRRFFDRGEKEFLRPVSNNHGLVYHHLLNLPNTPEDVRFRQSGVRELVENEDLYEHIGKVLTSQEMYGFLEFYSDAKSIQYSCDMTPEKMAQFIGGLRDLGDFNPESGPFNVLQSWGELMSQDTLFNELVRDKRKVTDSRIIAIYTERFRDIRYGVLKPGVDTEEVFDFLDKSLDHYTILKENKRGKMKEERRDVVKYERPYDGKLVDLAVGHARQRMDVLNKLSSEMMDIPAFLMMAQVRHLYQGAHMYKELEGRGYPVQFPDILDEKGYLDVKDMLPIRMVLSEIRNHSEIKKLEMATNSFSYTPKHSVLQIEGPNKRGKSEAWRSLHLFNALANAGYPVPATYAKTSIVPASHFISCKGSSGRGGSELERSLGGVVKALKEVHDGDQVILDELGDASNAPTSLEIAKRLLPELTKRGCRVLATSHHHTLTSYIADELKGLSFMPDPDGKGVMKYRLVPSSGEIDFKPQETLDGMGFTVKNVRKVMPSEPRLSPRRKDPGEKYHPEELEDIPF